MISERSLAQNSTTLAMSSGVPFRPIRLPDTALGRLAGSMPASPMAAIAAAAARLPSVGT